MPDFLEPATKLDHDIKILTKNSDYSVVGWRYNKEPTTQSNWCEFATSCLRTCSVVRLKDKNLRAFFLEVSDLFFQSFYFLF